MKDPKSVLIDFHGTLTDGKQHISSCGEVMFEAVHTRDIRAIRELTAMGFEVYIVTASSNPIIDEFCRRVGAEKLKMRNKVLENNGQLTFPYYAIGDDVWDIPLFRGAEKSFCPKDAEKVAMAHADVVLNVEGGKGVIAEFIKVELWGR